MAGQIVVTGIRSLGDDGQQWELLFLVPIEKPIVVQGQVLDLTPVASLPEAVIKYNLLTQNELDAIAAGQLVWSTAEVLQKPGMVEADVQEYAVALYQGAQKKWESAKLPEFDVIGTRWSV